MCTPSHSIDLSQQRRTDLVDEELIEFKGKHVAIVEALNIDLRHSQKEVARLEGVVAEREGDLQILNEQVGVLRQSQEAWKVELKEWADKHHMDMDEVKTRDEAISRLEDELQNSQARLLELFASDDA